MAFLRAEELAPRDRHHLMTSTILPRPIAWVMSKNEDGLLNLAPFSYFNGVCAVPPLVSVSVSKRRSGALKDTRRNIAATREYVIHVVDEAHAHAMVETSGDYPPETSEVDLVDLKTVSGETVDVPRLADAAVAMECRLVEIHEPPGAAAALVIGEILAWHVNDPLLVHDEAPLRVDVHKLRPIGRLGGVAYSPVREVFEMKPPS